MVSGDIDYRTRPRMAVGPPLFQHSATFIGFRFDVHRFLMIPQQCAVLSSTPCKPSQSIHSPIYPARDRRSISDSVSRPQPFADCSILQNSGLGRSLAGFHWIGATREGVPSRFSIGRERFSTDTGTTPAPEPTPPAEENVREGVTRTRTSLARSTSLRRAMRNS